MASSTRISARRFRPWRTSRVRSALPPAALPHGLRLTPDYFARIFRRTYGVSPRTWIVRERIKLAALRLTESQLSIGEVANEFGYGDIFFFSRQFKQVMGRSPRSYRRSA